MFGDSKWELQWNFKFPQASGLLIHLQIPKSKTLTNFFEFYFKKAKFRCLVI
jgi:hypothetical protein